jgi:hypothetical protein
MGEGMCDIKSEGFVCLRKSEEFPECFPNLIAVQGHLNQSKVILVTVCRDIAMPGFDGLNFAGLFLIWRLSSARNANRTLR